MESYFALFWKRREILGKKLEGKFSLVPTKNHLSKPNGENERKMSEITHLLLKFSFQKN